MLDFSQTKRIVAPEYDVSQLSGPIEEGALVVGVLEDNKVKMQASTGAASEVAFGFAFSAFVTPTSAPATEYVTVGSDGSIVLNNVVSAGVAPVVYASSFDVVANEVKRGALLSGGSVTGNVISGVSGVKAGDTVIVTYRHDLSAQQASAFVGDLTSPRPSEVTGTIGVIKIGRVYTSKFDTSVDWTVALAPGSIKTGPNGTVTTAGSGAAVPGAVVYELPTSTSPFLGLDVNFV